LTTDGVKRLQQVLKQTKPYAAPQLIAASPYIRAQQTALLASGAWGGAEIVTSTRITPDSSPNALWQEVRELDTSPLLLVAHEPLLSAAASWMLGESKVVVDFRPASLVALAFDQWTPTPKGRLQWKIHG
jgi:phosphohistidine phosphatase SixA